MSCCRRGVRAEQPGSRRHQVKAPLGLNEDLPAGRQNVGGSGSAGPMTTASGLVFIGATNDRRFRAFDAKTGKELWTTQLGQAIKRESNELQGSKR